MRLLRDKRYARWRAVQRLAVAKSVQRENTANKGHYVEQLPTPGNGGRIRRRLITANGRRAPAITSSWRHDRRQVSLVEDANEFRNLTLECHR